MIAHRFINIDISKVTIKNYKQTLSESLSSQVEIFIPPEGSFDDGCLKRYLENVLNSNTLKLHSYKFNDDIFKRIAVTPDGKNHGMMMLLDWSGSMSDILSKTVDQLINLVYFCQKINIPYEVYLFTSEVFTTQRGDLSLIHI